MRPGLAPGVSVSAKAVVAATMTAAAATARLSLFRVLLVVLVLR